MNECSPNKPPTYEHGSIRDGLAEVHESLAHITLQLESLSEKLDPVLRPDCPAACGPGSTVQLVDGRAPLSGHIDDLKATADSVSRQVQNIFGRVDV